MTRIPLLTASLLLAAGCFSEPPTSGDDVVDHDVERYGCSPLFAQDIVPEYRVTIADAEWAALEDEFLHRVEREAQGLDVHPYHPISLDYAVDGSVTNVPNVLIRLKGQSSWIQSIQIDPEPKMQFVLAFNEVDPNARFEGVRKVELDMPRSDRTFLQHRIGLSFLREAGLPAQCANSARLVINGSYYGFYTHIERQDKEWLQRLYGKTDDNGDLWESGRIIKTNEETFSWDRLDSLWNMTELDTFYDLVDEDASFDEWAGEAVIGDADGYYNGRANFMLYDHPTRGFVWMPSDLDTTMDEDFLPPTSPPVVPPAIGGSRWERDWFHYLWVVQDPPSLDQYIGALDTMLAKLDPDELETRISQYAAQIAPHVEADPRKPFTMADHDHAVSQMLDYPAARAAYLDSWLDCWVSGGDDADADGMDMCHDCNDAMAEVHPGAPEVCNAIDDNCDGHVDNVDGVTVCEQ